MSTSEQVPVVPGAHLVLVGLPGAGKTTIGIALSHRLRWPFLDFDAEIARRAGKSVQDIFAADGEAAFRAREMDLTRDLVGKRPSVLSPGGGWIVNSGAVGLLRPPAKLVHLRIPPPLALRRVLRSPTVRPLFAKGDPAAIMDRLYHERSPLYATADHVIDVEGLDFKRVTDLILELACPWAGGLG